MYKGANKNKIVVISENKTRKNTERLAEIRATTKSHESFDAKK